MTIAAKSFRDMFPDVASLHAALNEHGYKCDRALAAQLYAALLAKPTPGFFAFGRAGVGKTFVAETLAKVTGSELVYYQCMPGSREDDLFLKLMPNRRGEVVSVPGPIVRACELAQQNRRVLLMLDELDKARPSFDSTLLDFLQSGRVNFGDISLQLTADQLSLLTVIIGMNDERELSEPLERRLPLIEFKAISVPLMRELLLRKHGADPYERALVDPAVKLYADCLQLGINCGTQVLSQLISAAALLGEDADWDTLVRQFVTKRADRHQLLVQHSYSSASEADADAGYDSEPQEDRSRLNVEAYSTPVVAEAQAEAPAPRMPQLRLMELPLDDPEPAPPEEEQEFAGFVTDNEEAYDCLVRCFGEPGDTQVRVGPARVLDNGYIVFDAPLPLSDFPRLEEAGLLVHGQLTFVADHVDFEVVDTFVRGHKEWRYNRYSKQVVHAVYRSKRDSSEAQILWVNGRLELAVTAYDPDSRGLGVERLLKALDEHRVQHRVRDRSRTYEVSVRLGAGYRARVKIDRVNVIATGRVEAKGEILVPVCKEPKGGYRLPGLLHIEDAADLAPSLFNGWGASNSVVEHDGQLWYKSSWSYEAPSVGEAVHKAMHAMTKRCVQFALRVRALKREIALAERINTR